MLHQEDFLPVVMIFFPLPNVVLVRCMPEKFAGLQETYGCGA